jgi:gluconokinase
VLPAPVVVVMGVSGSGKSTVGRLLAERLRVEFAEGDDFHPAANIRKMASGHALDDQDRAPWLAAIADWIAARADRSTGAVVSCSALRRRYRDVLRGSSRPHPLPVWFLYPEADRSTIVARVAARTQHYMPVSLVNSQFEALEPLQPDEPGLVVKADLGSAAIVDLAARALGR